MGRRDNCSESAGSLKSSSTGFNSRPDENVPMREIRCFISSPGDVGQERLLAVRVIERLELEFRQRLQLKPIIWEHEPLRASDHFQSQIVPPAETDIVICILWSRLGTRLPADFRRADGTLYESGTEWEFENAIEAFRQKGTPDLLVYRKTSEAVASLQSKDLLLAQLAQKEALDRFVDRWFGNPTSGFRAAFHSFASADEFERILETHLRSFLSSKVGAALSIPAGPGVGTWHRGTPFRGLSPFDVDHADIFFGRTRAIGELKTRLQRRAQSGVPFVVVMGMSGSGKSSLVRAGLVPTLIVPGVVEGVGLWRHAIVRPADSSEGLRGLLGSALTSATALPNLAEMGFQAATLNVLLQDHPEVLTAPIQAALESQAKQVAEKEKLSHPPQARLLLVIDQLEEIFTHTATTPAERDQFARALSALVRGGQVWVIATLRSDMYARLTEVAGLIELKGSDGQYDLLPPAAGEIEQMIQYPARVAGVGFEVDPQSGIGLDKSILESASRNPEALPLLEFTLDELYKRREKDLMTFSAYRQLGGLEGAIARRAEEVIESLPVEVRDRLPNLFRACIVTSTTGSLAPSGIRVSARKVTQTSADTTLVDALITARLLIADRDATGDQTVGFAHEALLRHWPRLTEWLQENQEFLRARSQAAAAADNWISAQRNPDYLLGQGKPLAVAESLLSVRDQLEPSLVEFIEASRRRVTGATRRRWTVIAGLATIFLLLVTTFGIYSFIQWRYADQLKIAADLKRDEANEQRLLAEQQRQLAQQRETEANQKRLEADQAREREAAALEEERKSRVAKEQALLQVQQALQLADFHLAFRNPALAHNQIQQNRNRSALAILEQTPEEMRHWEWNHVARRCREEIRSLQLDGTANDLAFSPRGRLIAVARNDDPLPNQPLADPAIELWDWVSYQKKGELKPLNQSAQQVVLTAGGDQAVSISRSEIVEWNVSSRSASRRTELANPDHVALSADGLTAAMVFAQPGDSGADSYELVLWDIPAQRRKTAWTRPFSPGDALALSADGRTAAVVEDYCGLAVFQTDRDEPLWTRPQPEGTSVRSTIFCLDLSPSSQRLAAGDYQGQVQVFDLDSPSRGRVLFGHENSVTCVKFSSEEGLFSAGWDSTVRNWELRTGKLAATYRGHENWVRGLAISPSGNTFASTSRDGQLKFWNPSPSGKPIHTFAESALLVDGVSWSVQGRWLVSAALIGEGSKAGHGLLFLDMRGGKAIDPGYGATAFAARAPDSNLFAMAGGQDSESQVRLLTLGSEGQFMPEMTDRGNLDGHAEAVLCGTFVGSEQLLTGDAGGTLILWNTRDATELARFQADSLVSAIVWHPHLQRAFAGSVQGQLLELDLSAKTIVKEIRLEGPIQALAAHPQAPRLAVSAGQPRQLGKIYLVDAPSGQVQQELLGHSDLVNCLAFNFDGSRLASGSADRTVKLWDIEHGLEALSLWGHQREVTCLAFDIQGHKLASGDNYGAVIVWDGTPLEKK